MKKLVLLIGIVIFSINVFAQNKGEKYLSTTLSGCMGTQTLKYIGPGYLHEYVYSQPLDFSVSATGEFAYFSADHFRLGFALGIPYYSSPVSEHNGVWYYTRMLGAFVNPNIAYYIPLGERAFYTPEIGVKLEMGHYSSKSETFDFNDYFYTQFSVYLNILAFEFRVNEKFAISIGSGVAYYYNGKIIGSQGRTQQWILNLSSGTVAAVFYL